MQTNTHQMIGYLEALAAELGLEVRKQSLQADDTADFPVNIQSNCVLLRGQRILFLDRRLNAQEKARIIAKTLKEHYPESLENLYLPPAIRSQLERF